MIKRIISCIVSTVIVLGATIAYDRTPACRIAVMEQVPDTAGFRSAAHACDCP